MAGSYTSDTVYTGEEKVVISIDLGTTQSAVSFAYLYPQDNPIVRLVNKWPGQPEASGNSKVPSIVAYRGRTSVACGAEALEYVDDEEYHISKWFKLHLHPDSMKTTDLPPSYDSNTNDSPTIEIPPLPPGITAKRVYADFLRYLFETTREFFKHNTPAGARIWSRLENEIVFVLATPNGWDNEQQAFLRDAALDAGLINDEESADLRLEFVTEGEASVHYALAHTQSKTWLRQGVMFAVTDAGGSTVDSTLYECKAMSPKLVLEEVCSSECVQAGGVFVDRAAHFLLQEKLADSKFGEEEFIGLIVQEFEKKTKRIYDGNQTSNVIHFGRSTDNDRPHGILKGKLLLTREEVGQTYDDVTTRIVNSCLKLLRGRKVLHLLLVGGFGESPYLRTRLKDIFESQGTEVVTIDEPSRKAAAEGATIWYIKQLVVARASRFSFGTIVSRDYRPDDSEDRTRKHKCYVDVDGRNTIDGIFDVWVKKNTVIAQDMKQTFDYNRPFSTLPSNLGTFGVSVYAWEGEGIPHWAKDESGILIPHMRYVCELRADLGHLRRAVTKERGPNGVEFWKVVFKVAIVFGGTRLQAKLLWEEGNKQCEGPVMVIPNSTI